MSTGTPPDRDRTPVDRSREDRSDRGRCHQPGQRRAHPDLDRRLRAGRLRHRRDHGRARPRRARLRVRRAVRAADPAGRRARPGGRRRAAGAAMSPIAGRAAGRQRSLQRLPATKGGAAYRGRPCRAAGPRPVTYRCATGCSAASATGGRPSRSSTASATGSCPSRRRTCRSGCRTRSTTSAAGGTR